MPVLWNALLTIVCVYLLVMLVPPAINWLFVKAVWTEAPPETCRAAEGACWAFIREKHRVILFGRYPYDEQWRPLLGIAVLLTMVLVSCFRRFWRPWIGAVWLGGLALFFVLMWGGDISINYRSLAFVLALVVGVLGITRAGASGMRGLLLWIAALLLILGVAGGAILRGLDSIIGLAGVGPIFAGIGTVSIATPTTISSDVPPK